MWFYTMLVFVIGCAAALPQPEINAASKMQNVQEKPQTVAEQARSMGKECPGGVFSATCLKIQAVSLLERLSSQDEISLLPGVSVVKEESNESSTSAEQVAAELARSMPGKPEERLDKYLLYRLGTYLDTHAVKLRLLDSNAAEDAKDALVEGRRRGGGGLGGGGKKGGMGGLLAAALLMKGTLLSIALGGLALLAGKALMTALMSLLLSAIIGLKSLTSGGGGKSTTYEIVSKPVYSHSHTASHSDEGHAAYGHSGYGRSYSKSAKRR